ncbi:MAG: hypothetical protein ACIRXY_00515 [Ligilactobacillus animalis]|uniref:hypothetical protein n=1 Tax=Ligilactobacillus animalis TaxID=1605 RepID=UPI0038299BF9
MVSKLNFPILSIAELQTSIGGSRPISDEENSGNAGTFFTALGAGAFLGSLAADANYTPKKRRKIANF